MKIYKEKLLSFINSIFQDFLEKQREEIIKDLELYFNKQLESNRQELLNIIEQNKLPINEDEKKRLLLLCKLEVMA